MMAWMTQRGVHLGIVVWCVVALSMAACMPVMPEGTPSAPGAETPLPQEEATGEATSEATEAPSEEPSGEVSGVDDAGIAVAAQVQQSLAAELQIETDQVEIVMVEAVEWPDACLGVYSADVMCAQVITPGYRVVLAVDGQQYVFHTNNDGSFVQRAEGPMSDDEATMGEDVIFVWYREGGIAGYCDVLTAYVSGQLEAATCYSDPPQVVATRNLDGAETDLLRGWLEMYASFEYRHDDGNVDDGMVIEFRFSGMGDEVPDEATQQEMVDTVQAWHASIEE